MLRAVQAASLRAWRWCWAARGRLDIRRVKSLKARLTIGSLSIGLVVFLLFSLTISRTAQKVAQTEARKRVEGVIGYLSEAVAESLAAEDRLQVKVLAKAFEKNGVQAILVTDRHGQTLHATQTDLPGDDLYLASELRTLDIGGLLGTTRLGESECLHAARPITFGGSPAGMVHVWFDKSDLEQSLREANTPIIFIFLLGFAALVVLGVASLHSPFWALKRLSSAAMQIRSGDFSARVPVKGSDEVAEFSSAFNAMVDGLVQARQKALESQLETIHAMINTVEAKDRYTAGHCLRVGGYAKEIVSGLKELGAQDAFVIQTAGLLHDIGKLGIPDMVLLKEGALTAEEIEIIRRHVVVGEEILSHMDSMKQIARAIRHHHERWDGKGYPDGLAGQAIPLASRVVGVADAIDAMLTDRPYRKALPLAAVIKALKDGSGKQFDPAVVDLAVEHLTRREKENEAVRHFGRNGVPAPELELQAV